MLIVHVVFGAFGAKEEEPLKMILSSIIMGTFLVLWMLQILC